jgi:hypothetical protein
MPGSSSTETTAAGERTRWFGRSRSARYLGERKKEERNREGVGKARERERERGRENGGAKESQVGARLGAETANPDANQVCGRIASNHALLPETRPRSVSKRRSARAGSAELHT